MTTVKVGQVWRDKDKRRNTVIEIIKLNHDSGGQPTFTVTGLVVGTEEERIYSVDRLVKRWELISEKQEKIHETREAWLMEGVKLLSEQIFDKHKVPTTRVSVGWPRAAREATIGQCFMSTASEDKSSHIFISPVLSDPVKVLATLAHELVHAIDDVQSGHGGRFKDIAREIGLEGKLTATHAGEALTEKLKVMIGELGEYPHSKITTQKKVTQKTYMLKLVSPEEPDFFVRMTQKKLDEYGYPRDPWGNEMELE